MRVTELMDVDEGDEVGTPDEEIVHCVCDVMFRRGSWHECSVAGERLEWSEFRDRDDVGDVADGVVA